MKYCAEKNQTNAKYFSRTVTIKKRNIYPHNTQQKL